MTYSSITHSERIVTFPLQQWLCNSAIMFCYAYIIYLAFTLWYVFHINLKIDNNDLLIHPSPIARSYMRPLFVLCEVECLFAV